MGLGDSGGWGELHLIRLAKLTRLKKSPHVLSKGEFREGVLEVQLDWMSPFVLEL